MKLPLITNPTEEQLQLRLVPEGEQRVRNKRVQPLQERTDLNHASVNGLCDNGLDKQHIAVGIPVP